MIKLAAMVGTPDLRAETLAVYSGNLELAFSHLAALGYTGVELMTRDPEQLDGNQIRRCLDANGLHLVGLCTGHVFGEDGLGLVGPDPARSLAARERLKSFVDFAAEYFGPDTLVNIGRSRGTGIPGDPVRSLTEMCASFRDLAEYAAPGGIKLVLEPINSLQTAHIHTTQDGIEMVTRVDHPNFGLMLDLCHMNIEDVDIYNSFRLARPFLRFVHLTDNNRHWPGSAHLEFDKIFAVLREIEYSGFASLEIMPWPDSDTAARASIQYLSQWVDAK
jgi:sugar phosphate isomerase/epimerase